MRFQSEMLLRAKRHESRCKMQSGRLKIDVGTPAIGPMTPHLAEELWGTLGHATLLAESAWPVAEETLLRDDTLTIAVQLNGKLRGTLQLPKDSAKDVAEEAALALPEIARALDGQVPKRVIVVPNRIVNVVL